jgi:hypothetical protein
LLGLVSRIYISTWIVWEILETIGQTSILSNIIGLVHSIILFVITFWIVYFIWKSLKWKATFIDTLLSYPYYICLYNTDNH